MGIQISMCARLSLFPAWSRPLQPLVGVWPDPAHFFLLWVCDLTYRESGEETADGDSVPTLQGALLKAKAHTSKIQWVSNVHV